MVIERLDGQISFLLLIINGKIRESIRSSKI